MGKEENIITGDVPVSGMHCAACALNVERALKAQQGVKDASVNYASNRAHLSYNKALTSAEKLKKAIQDIGYDLIITTNEAERETEWEQEQQKQYRQLKINVIGSAVLAVPVMVLAMAGMHIPYVNYIMLALSAPVVTWFGRSFFINAWKQAKHFSADMDTLVALGTGVSFLFSLFSTLYPQFWTARGLQPHVYYEGSSAVIFFILLGRWLESTAKAGTTGAIRKLMGLQPKTVKAVRAKEELEIPIADVRQGDTIIVRPGEKIPVDGKIAEGHSFINESMLSGEPVPVEKGPDNMVYAGTINQSGSFRFVAEHIGSETVLAQIIKTVQQAQSSKAPVQKLVDKIAGIFVPIVMAVAVITFIIWMIFGGANALTHAFLASVTVLVIACPCALGLATPTAIMVGMGKGADNNILIKDAENLQQLGKVNVLVLDKTGTVTEGRPTVTDLIWMDDVHNEDILYAIESLSEHPLAKAVVENLGANKRAVIKGDELENIPGRGIKAKVNGVLYAVGNEQLMEACGVIIGEKEASRSAQMKATAKTLTYFATGTKLLALIAIADKIKQTSAEAVAGIQKMGIEVYLLTGDNAETAAAVSAQAGIKNFKAGVSPTGKASIIKELQQQGKTVAMAGDGINDSTALAQADVSIAMGRGSDIAMDVAKITLITSDLRAIAKAIRLSRKTTALIKQNLFWASIYNVVAIPIAAGILFPINGFMLNPMIAGAAMAFSSVSVVSNSLRLKFAKI